MKEVRIEFTVSPVGNESEVVGSYHFNTDDDSDLFVLNALKKSIKRLKIAQENIIIGIFDVFIDNKRSFEMGLFKSSTIVKTDIRKV